MVPATSSFTAQNVRKLAKLIRPEGFHPEPVAPEADIRRPNFTDRNEKPARSSPNPSLNTPRYLPL
jgi:hypothetical protein